MLQVRQSSRYRTMATQPDAFSTSPRRAQRVQLNSFATVTLDHEKEAILLDLSESGLRLQSTQTWKPGNEIYLSFFLPNSFILVEGAARVIWSDVTGKSGLQFVDEEMQSLVVDWIEDSAARKKSVQAVRVRPTVH